MYDIVMGFLGLPVDASTYGSTMQQIGATTTAVITIIFALLCFWLVRKFFDWV